MALRGTDLIAIVLMVSAVSALCCVFLWWRVRALVSERQLRIADQIGALDNAIRAMETRLAEHQPVLPVNSQPALSVAEVGDNESADTDTQIDPEIQAVIAAAALAAVGPNVALRSIKSAASPWTQQGRVLVQGGHNLRVRR